MRVSYANVSGYLLKCISVYTYKTDASGILDFWYQMKDVLYNDIRECILETIFKNKIKFSFDEIETSWGFELSFVYLWENDIIFCSYYHEKYVSIQKCCWFILRNILSCSCGAILALLEISEKRIKISWKFWKEM